ncbi:hypothetical protein [Streptomyces triticiradicis]|uniref:Uncharacterized protein n=1 Tax=Streptomyces triticiradicis TaxID=2651189 RepID=A0A7J5DAF9_9ACTN|nr:hypothetical protein [Streptomyces triticiradicis]KAB1985759.1 hypothetical protein F8144_26165 [Streptomyces triticiradicis]
MTEDRSGRTDTIPLSRGDLRWIFPEVRDPGTVRGALSEADAQVRALVRHLGVLPGGVGGGLEFHRVEGIVVAGLFGAAEAEGLAFTAELYFPRRCPWDLRWGPPWEVTAEVMAVCDQVRECGGHILAERAGTFTTPLEAAGGLVEATAWLLDRGVTEPPASWRSRDDARCRGATP